MNRLEKEKSPYLQQHKNNPVDWYPWCEEAFAAARAQNKPIFLSIGYSTCYWCHVMEKESFEREDVGLALNENYICIKVDREEHPEVDEIYMDAVIGIAGRGGWPMSVFLTPDLKPFWGGTYFPRQQFLGILAQLHKFWQEKPEEILDASKKLAEHLQEDLAKNSNTDKNLFSEEVLDRAFQQLQNRFDARHGGFGSAPKFPPSMSIFFLLRETQAKKNEKALAMACATLDAMACGGIHDHLGGGFHRYSTDEIWLVPHFEKMLYDNALLAIAYTEAYQITGKKFYREIAESILNYILRDMQSDSGGYYSAEDAGEVQREGEFYVWKKTEVQSILTEEEFTAFTKIYPITEQGNFEPELNILCLQQAEQWELRGTPLMRMALQKLFSHRSSRTKPHRDTKILSSWNGLMMAAMAKGYQVFGEEEYLLSAERCAKFLQENLFRENQLLRRYAEDEAKYEGTLTDYAYVIFGLQTLYEANFQEEYLLWAKTLQSIQDELFWDEKDAAYFTASKKEKNLIARKKDHSDGALPAGNSMAAGNLLRFYHYFFEEKYEAQAKEIFECFASDFSRVPSAYAMALTAFAWLVRPVQEIAIVASATSLGQEFVCFFQKNFHPRKVLAYTAAQETVSPSIPLLEGKKTDGGNALVYVCEEKTCLHPVKDLAALESLL